MSYERVKCIPFPGIENAYVVISARKAERTGNKIAKCMSFFYANGNVGAEWEPDHGPITVIYRCEKENEEAKPHWFYPYYTGLANWSQLAVEEEELPEAFLTGDYDHIFWVLEKWSERPSKHYIKPMEADKDDFTTASETTPWANLKSNPDPES